MKFNYITRYYNDLGQEEVSIMSAERPDPIALARDHNVDIKGLFLTIAKTHKWDPERGMFGLEVIIRQHVNGETAWEKPLILGMTGVAGHAKSRKS